MRTRTLAGLVAVAAVLLLGPATSATQVRLVLIGGVGGATFDNVGMWEA